MAKLLLTEGTRLGILALGVGVGKDAAPGGAESRAQLSWAKRGYQWEVNYLSLCLCFPFSPFYSTSSSGILLILFPLWQRTPPPPQFAQFPVFTFSAPSCLSHAVPVPLSLGLFVSSPGSSPLGLRNSPSIPSVPGCHS